MGKFLQGMCLGVFFAALLGSKPLSAEEAAGFHEALTQGEISGEIGNYFEYTQSEASDADFGWSTAYLQLKYETLRWKNIQAGAAFFGHGDIYSDHDAGSDPFDIDVEKKVTIPELYLDYSFLENSGVRVGRWNHRDTFHFDDNQSEGAYLKLREIENLELYFGFMSRFAEIDYDDGEDFGRTNDAQDLSDEGVYGPGSRDYAFFGEIKWEIPGVLKTNPFLIHQHGYAGVYGIDNDLYMKVKDSKVTVGTEINYYHVRAEIDGSGDANNYFVAPYVKWKPFSLQAGYARFDDGDALIRPAWMHDNYLSLDQIKAYGNPDSDVFFGKFKIAFTKFWTHFAWGDYTYAMTGSEGDGSTELEWQAGYKFSKAFDVNVRLFDVSFDNVADKDYQKVESRIRFRF